MADDKDSPVQSLEPLIETDIRPTQADANAVDSGLDAAFEKMSVQKVDLEVPAVAAVDPSPVQTAHNEHFVPNPFENLPNIETGVVSPSSPSAPSALEPDEAPTPAPVGMSSAGKANWKRLEESKTKYKNELKAQMLQVEALKGQLMQYQAALQNQNVQIPAQIEQELKALREFRDIFGVEHHSEFVKKFDQEIVSFNQKIGSLLVNRGMPRTIADAKALAEKEQQKEVGISVEALLHVGFDQIDPAFWDTSIFPKINSIERRQLEDALIGILNTKEARQKAIQEAVSRRDEYLKQAEQIKAAELEAEKNLVYAELEEYYKIAPWAKRITPTGSETPEVRTKIDAWNKQIDLYENQFVAAYRPQNTKQRVQTAVCAVLVMRQTQEISALRQAIQILQQKLAEKEQKINGIKSATTVRQNTVATPKANSQAMSQDDLLKMSDREALDHRFKELGI